MKIKEFASRCYQINLGMVNCFMIDDNGITLIDTGYPRDKLKIIRALSEIGKGPKDIKQIILTHLHPDHSGSAGTLQKELQIPVFAHAFDAELLKMGVCGRMPYLVTKGIMNRLLFSLVVLTAPKSIVPVTSVTLIGSNEIIPVLSGLRVIHTPGHSLGHVALLFEQQKILIAGDTVVNNFGLRPAPLYEDPGAGISSIKHLCQFDFEIACFGHGGIITKNANQKFKDLSLRLNYGNTN